MAPKTTRTVHSRIDRYVKWFYDMLTEPELHYDYQSDRNKVIALCTMHLTQGSTIFSTTIKSITVKRCIMVALSVSLNHENLDPLLETRELEAQCINNIIS